MMYVDHVVVVVDHTHRRTPPPPCDRHTSCLGGAALGSAACDACTSGTRGRDRLLTEAILVGTCAAPIVARGIARASGIVRGARQERPQVACLTHLLAPRCTRAAAAAARGDEHSTRGCTGRTDCTSRGHMEAAAFTLLTGNGRRDGCTDDGIYVCVAYMV